MDIDNRHRAVSWESVAREMQSERDALRSDVMRLNREIWHRDAEIERLRATERLLQSCVRRLEVDAERYRWLRSARTRQQRELEFEPPIAYDWHTVAIEPPQPKSAPQGGHHASPRQHDRRGHFRNTRSGKRVFVRQCVVGKADRGAVFKDYRA